jgi:hypothetical protein
MSKLNVQDGLRAVKRCGRTRWLGLCQVFERLAPTAHDLAGFDRSQ